MRFSKLAEKLQELEQTSSRNAMTELLAKLIKEMDESEAKETIYLILGRLRPLYDSLEFNLAEKQIVKSLAVASGKTGEEVTRDYKEKGDLGIVAQDLLRRKGEGLRVKEVFERLTKIAEDQGAGSQERKIEGLAQLLGSVDSLSAKYVVRIVLHRTRLGFSDKTILDALSVAHKGDKSAKGELELAYQVRPDIGLLVEDVKKKGIEKAVKEVEMELGIPIMPMLSQRLKSPKEMIKKMGEVAVEPKFDGTRVAIYFNRKGKQWMVKTYTRNLEENSYMFPELLKIDDHVKADSLVLDSEAVGYDPKTKKLLPFQMTITRKRKHGIELQLGKVPLKFFVFDVMYKDGKSLIDKSYKERRKILRETVKDRELLVVDDYWVTTDPGEIKERHEEMLKQGLEGVIVKKVESKYVPGRTGWRWVKMKEVEEAHAKLADTIDCVIMGYYRGRGKRASFGLGAFLAGVVKGDQYVTITKVGTGLSDEQFRELNKKLETLISREKPLMYEVDKNLEPDVWVDPGVVVELAADEITKSPNHTAGMALRFPRLIKFRDDKRPEQATTVEEIESIKR